MPFDLYATQKSLMTSLETLFPQYAWFRNTIPEDEEVPRQGTEVNPFFVLQFGQLYSRPNGMSVKGARNDEYYSWVQVIAMGSVDDDINSALSLIVDRLIGFKPAGATKLKPVGGFCAETGGAMTLFLATMLGIPVSTTHTITGAIVGVGSTQRASAVRWGVAGNIVWAWILTIPASAFVAAIAYWVSLQLF